MLLSRSRFFNTTTINLLFNDGSFVLNLDMTYLEGCQALPSTAACCTTLEAVGEATAQAAVPLLGWYPKPLQPTGHLVWCSLAPWLSCGPGGLSFQ